MPLRTRLLRFVTWLGFVASSLGAPLPALAAPQQARLTDGRTAVGAGVELERSRKWLDAIEHYEAALKKFPDSTELEYGLRRSKIHFGVERRYNDPSFEKTLLALPQRDAMLLFDDVLDQVRQNYVEPITLTSLVAHGTESLYLALANDDFLRRNIPAADATRVAHLRRTLREQYWNKPAATATAARDVVNEVCTLAQSQAGLRSGAVVMEYVFGACNALDDYSSYLTPHRLDDLYGNIEGEFVGLGIEMKADESHGLLLVNVLPESPASEGGLMPGDHVITIDGVDCRNVTTDEGAKLLRGLPGSRVKLQVRRPGFDRLYEGTFARRAVHVKSIPVAKIIDHENGVGYIQMTGFQKSSSAELDEALATLKRQGMRALVWDLRGNPGGLLTAAVEVLDRFIGDGVLVSTRGRSRDQNWTYSAHRAATSNVPLVLLVDGDSASASEIVAGAINDHKRGTIIGRQTYGKWSVQSIFPVRNNTGLRLTTAKFYSPDGLTLGKIGVKPHIAVELPEQHATAFRGPLGPDPAEDLDLQKALEVLRSPLTQR